MEKIASILTVPFEVIFEPELNINDTNQNFIIEGRPDQNYKLPKEIIDNLQEYITVLKIEIDTLKTQNRILKQNLLYEKE
jgi:hypothetical protein